MLNQTKEYSQAETASLKGLAAGGHYELAKTCWALGRGQDAAPHGRKAVAGMPDLGPAPTPTPVPAAMAGFGVLEASNFGQSRVPKVQVATGYQYNSVNFSG